MLGIQCEDISSNGIEHLLSEHNMNFVPFDQTQFTDDNIDAMALLIVLFERKHVLINELKQYND